MSNSETITTNKLNDDMFWHTKDGSSIPFSMVTHSHWSNIYWYHLMLVEKFKTKLELKPKDFLEEAGQEYYRNSLAGALHHVELAKTQINLRFNGEILDWVPVYENEKRWYEAWCTRKILIEKIKC